VDAHEEVLTVADLADGHGDVDVTVVALESPDVEHAVWGRERHTRDFGRHGGALFTRRMARGNCPPVVTARSVWFVAPRSVEVRASELPPLQPGQVLVRTDYSGISSGTEMLAYRGQLDPDMVADDTIKALGGDFRYPFQYGYSCVGVVESSRSEHAVGDVVFAFQPHQDLFIAAADDVVAMGDVDRRQATLFPLVETALQITLDAGSVFGETVAVFGLGVVGALTALLLGRAGATVVGVDPSEWRRDALASLGVRAVDPEQLPAALTEAGGVAEVPLAIEASGNPRALRTALGVLAHEGTALVASWYGSQQVPLPLGERFHRRRLTIRSTQVSTVPAHLSGRWNVERRRRHAADLLRSLPLDRFATHEFRLDDAGEAYGSIDNAPRGMFHAALWYG
jgi:2-desacetyl-2-hydroxyethyl bacteriochlorophyllide A dehydrogenase